MIDTYHGKPCPTHGTTLRMVKNRQCRECYLESKRRWGKNRDRCSVTSMVYSRLRKQNITQAMPRWVDRKEINKIYASRKEGQHVDHIVPLKGIDPVTKEHVVSGLHVPWNLRVVDGESNTQKWAWWEASK